MIKLTMNQNTYNKLLNKDENTFYFIDNTLKDDEIKNCDNYLLNSEVAIIRKKILESEVKENNIMTSSASEIYAMDKLNYSSADLTILWRS